jgi:ABC-type multidrug transport system fused ATPase/permease subunit
MCFVGYAIGQVYTRTATSVKRLASESQSPIFAHFSEILAGLSVVRARAGMTEIMQSQMAAKLRVWARTAEAQYNANRWFDFRSDLAASIVSLGAGTIALVKSGSVSTGLVGFSLTNAIGLGQTTILLFRAMNELEIEMTSFSTSPRVCKPSNRGNVWKQSTSWC